MKEQIPLTKQQKEIMQEFYGLAPARVIFDKQERKEIWDKATHRKMLDFAKLKKLCPALEDRIQTSYELGENIQSAVFSECVYAQTYAKAIKDELYDWIMATKAKALIPVPLHKKRLIARGYNQSKILADEISALTGIPVADKCVERVQNTAPQKLFNRKQRLINVKKAFIVRENVVKLDTVIIVDDIFTTGSTIDSLAGVLKESGVKKVFFLTVTAAGT